MSVAAMMEVGTFNMRPTILGLLEAILYEI
jgi:hypothetical protein